MVGWGVGFSGEPPTHTPPGDKQGWKEGGTEEPLVQKDVDQVLLQGGSPTTPQLQGDKAPCRPGQWAPVLHEGWSCTGSNFRLTPIPPDSQNSLQAGSCGSETQDQPLEHGAICRGSPLMQARGPQVHKVHKTLLEDDWTPQPRLPGLQLRPDPSQSGGRSS